ncbi:zinc finger MYM-type protein 1-like, partial [Aphis craccivora]
MKKVAIGLYQKIHDQKLTQTNFQLSTSTELIGACFIQDKDMKRIYIKQLSEKRQFTDNHSFLVSISYLYPQSEQFLSYKQLKPLISELKSLSKTIKNYPKHNNKLAMLAFNAILNFPVKSVKELFHALNINLASNASTEIFDKNKYYYIIILLVWDSAYKYGDRSPLLQALQFFPIGNKL